MPTATEPHPASEPQKVAQAPPQPAPTPAPLDQIRLPEGFHISYYASDVPGARSLCLGARGTVFVGTRDQGTVYALVDDNGDRRADRVLTIARGLNYPNGVAFRIGSLYVAEIHRLIRYDNIEQRLDNPPAPVVVRGDFPTDRSHGWKFIAFGPDGRLYVPIGVNCNICPRREPYGTILSMNADGSGRQTFARGLRNSVGFDWEPGTGVLWFTDNGRDRMGDDVPPDELNRAPRAGMDFGFPYCHGKSVLDPEYGRGRNCSDFTPPVVELGPHVAALGMRFYTGSMFPAQYSGGIFIAEHGSWDRSTPIGYRVMFVPVAGGQAQDYRVFAQGWLQGGRAWGRPVDVLVMPDGSLLVSDDEKGCVYRITYG
ncbi:MAG: PQQ-dependent sugar dehydrogenase [Armatimonadota bacterium]